MALAPVTAASFQKANSESLVVEGWANEPNPHKPAQGATYVLEDGRQFRLEVEECRKLETGYPKWKLD